jgi:hypothetical protein
MYRYAGRIRRRILRDCGRPCERFTYYVSDARQGARPEGLRPTHREGQRRDGWGTQASYVPCLRNETWVPERFTSHPSRGTKARWMRHPGFLRPMSQKRDMGARAVYVPLIARDKGAMDGAPGLLTSHVSETRHGRPSGVRPTHRKGQGRDGWGTRAFYVSCFRKKDGTSEPFTSHVSDARHGVPGW